VFGKRAGREGVSKKKVQAIIRNGAGLREFNIDDGYKGVSVRRQCELLGYKRSGYYYEKNKERQERDAEILALIRDKEKVPSFYGSIKIYEALKRYGYNVKYGQIRRILEASGIKAAYPKKITTISRQDHKKYPYKLRGLKIERRNQVWATDLTYIKLERGQVYLMAIIDIYSRKVLKWGIYNSLNASGYSDLLRETIEEYGAPEMFNSDQGSQFTNGKWIRILEEYEIEISMDGKGRALDNVYVERLWKSLKYEDIYLNRYESVCELLDGLEKYFNFYNRDRIHQSLNYATPDEIYGNMEIKAA